MLNFLSLCFNKKLIFDKSQIIDLFRNQDYNNLVNYDIYDLYIFIKNLSTRQFLLLRLKDNFIIDFYNKFLTKKLDIKDYQYLNLTIRKLITLYLFFSFNNNINILNLIIKKPILFDIDLWLSLLLDPIYNEDENHLFLTLYLVKHNIIMIYKPIQFYNLKFNVFELIIMGKFDIFDNNVVHNRFFQKEFIINFIKQIYKCSNMIINKELIDLLQIYYNKNPIYVNDVVTLLNSPFI